MNGFRFLTTLSSLALIGVLLFWYASDLPDQGGGSGSFTVAPGLDAPPGTFPATAKIVVYEKGAIGALFYPLTGVHKIDGGCTGTLIAPQVVLTAAHCFFDPPSPAATGKLLTGMLYGFRPMQAGRGWTTSSMDLRGGALVLFPGYGPNCPSDCDIAMVRLKASVPANVAVPAALATAQSWTSHGSLVIAGFGIQFPPAGKTRQDPANLQFFAPVRVAAGSSGTAMISLQGKAERSGKTVAVAVCPGDSGGGFYLAKTAQTLDPTMFLAGVNQSVAGADVAVLRDVNATALAKAEACTKEGTLSKVVNIIPKAAWINQVLRQWNQ